MSLLLCSRFKQLMCYQSIPLVTGDEPILKKAYSLVTELFSMFRVNCISTSCLHHYRKVTSSYWFLSDLHVSLSFYWTRDSISQRQFDFIINTGYLYTVVVYLGCNSLFRLLGISDPTPFSASWCLHKSFILFDSFHHAKERRNSNYTYITDRYLFVSTWFPWYSIEWHSHNFFCSLFYSAPYCSFLLCCIGNAEWSTLQFICIAILKWWYRQTEINPYLLVVCNK